jgi:hypothetical protein
MFHIQMKQECIQLFRIFKLNDVFAWNNVGFLSGDARCRGNQKKGENIFKHTHDGLACKIQRNE